MSSNKEILPLPKKLEDDLQSYSNKLYKKDINKKNDQEQNIETTSKQKLTKVFDDSIEKAMYDEIFGSILPKNNNKLPSNNNKVINTNRAPLLDTSTTNNDFNTTIINKLHQVEKESKELRLIIAQLTIKNENLTNENNILQSLVNNNDTTIYNTNNNDTALNNNTNMKSFEIIKELKNRNQLLENKIIQMEAFLGDYGLVWVGNHHSQTTTSSSILG